MNENSNVSVNIFGSTYDIKGSEQREYILKIANYVDENMTRISKHYTQYSSVMMAVLAAVQITDELYKKDEVIDEMQREKEKLLMEFEHKISMSEESKNSYIEQKKSAEKYLKNYQDSQKELYEKYELLRDTQVKLEKVQEDHLALESENIKLKEKVTNIGSSSSDQGKEMEELKARNLEIENHFFDTQMENVQMKKQIEQLKKEVELKTNGFSTNV